MFHLKQAIDKLPIYPEESMESLIDRNDDLPPAGQD